MGHTLTLLDFGGTTTVLSRAQCSTKASELEVALPQHLPASEANRADEFEVASRCGLIFISLGSN